MLIKTLLFVGLRGLSHLEDELACGLFLSCSFEHEKINLSFGFMLFFWPCFLRTLVFFICGEIETCIW